MRVVFRVWVFALRLVASGLFVALAIGVSFASDAPGPIGLEELRQRLEETEDYAAVEKQARELLAETQRVHGEESLEAARVLDLLVESLWRGEKAKAPEARQLAEIAVRIKATQLAADDLELADSLDNLGFVLRSNAEFEAAVSVFERSLVIREGAQGADHIDFARTLNFMGWAVYRLGDVEWARNIYENALQIREQQLGPMHPDVASSLNNLAIMLKQLGEYSLARAQYERALAIYEQSLGPNHTQTLSTLNNLAVLLKNQGDYATALVLFERVLALREAQYGPDHERLATVLVNLGLLRSRLGDSEMAIQQLRRALAIRRATFEPNAPRLASTLVDLGIVLARAGSLEQAEVVLREGTAIREGALKPGHPLIALSLHNLGSVYVRLGDLERARDCLERALAGCEAALGADHPWTAEVLWSLAELTRREGEPALARDLYRRAQAIYEMRLGEDHPALAAVLRELAATLVELEQYPEAFELAMRAATIGREHLRLTAQMLSEREALRYSSVRPAGQDLAWSLVLQAELELPGAESEVWDDLVHSRALVLDEMRSRQPVEGHGELGPRLQEASRRLANLLVRGVGSESVDVYRRRLQEARDARDAAERALAQASRSFQRQRHASRVGLAEVAADLPERSALVAYVKYEHHALVSNDETGEPATGYLAAVLHSGASKSVVVRLGSTEQIEALVASWRDGVRAARGGLPALKSRTVARYRKSAGALREAVWDPVVPHLREAASVYVVPDGALHLVSLATLPVKKKGYLLETGPRIHYLTAERDLVRMAAEREAEAGQGLLVVGGPDFDHGLPDGGGSAPGPEQEQGDCDSLSAMEFSALHGARREAEEIAGIWAGQAEPSSGSPVSMMNGPDASEEAFKREAPGRRALHVATHGFFLDNLCVGATETAAATDGLAPAPSNRLSLSGLALAGSNILPRLDDRDGEDGILTAGEIAAMDLSGVEWVVLSACDTAAGREQSGEGVLGLRRSFETAGADTVIMSLWAVEDTTTRNWMRRLYEERLGGTSTVDAVWQASKQLLEARRRAKRSTHPFYWGPFVAVGDWR